MYIYIYRHIYIHTVYNMAFNSGSSIRWLFVGALGHNLHLDRRGGFKPFRCWASWVLRLVKSLKFAIFVANGFYIWVFPKIRGKPPKWMVYIGKPYSMDDLGVPLFSETPISIESKLYILFTLSFNMNIQNVIRQSLWSSLLSFSCSLPRFIGCFVPKKSGQHMWTPTTRGFRHAMPGAPTGSQRFQLGDGGLYRSTTTSYGSRPSFWKSSRMWTAQGSGIC